MRRYPSHPFFPGALWIASCLAGVAPRVAFAQSAPTQPTQRAVPFGPYHLPPDRFAPPFTLAMAAPKSPDDAIPLLEAARAKGVRIFIHLTGGRSRHQNADYSFSLERFTQLLEAFRGVDFSPYIEDGTLLGHMLFDEPHDPTNWNGKPVPFETIDAAAAASKRLFPTVPVGLGSPPSWLRRGAPYRSLDFGCAQYVAKRGDCKEWVKAEVAAAAEARLKLLFSLNVLDGGGVRTRQPMSAEQLRASGTECLRQPGILGLLMWKWDEAYFSRPDIRDALAALAAAQDSAFVLPRPVRF
ncbi:MAG: hypothetical protein NTW86_12965 [Candidatus Sumerlaeota bacterium]|nr:hypothetical protein [Candidatus Sumerlaeota bacterium]